MQAISENDRIDAEAVSFTEIRQRLHLYLIALWGRTFALEAAGLDVANGSRPRIRDGIVYLPASLDASGAVAPQAIYRAAAAHAAAHLVYSEPLDPTALKPRQQLLIGLIEDARIEYLAFRCFPGLRRLWLSLHPPEPSDPAPFPSLMWRLSRALLMLEQSSDGDFWIQKGVRLLLEQRHCMHDPALARDIGLRLAHDIGQMRLSMDEGSIPPMAPYRDDNCHLWYEQRTELDAAVTSEDALAAQRTGTQLQEAVAGRSVAFTPDRVAQAAGPSGYRIETVADGARLRYFQVAPQSTEADTFRYPEWFEAIGVERENWCAVHEYRPTRSDSRWAEAALASNARLLMRLRRVIGALRARHSARLRRQKTGDEIDIDAAVTARADMCAGREPDLRVHSSARTRREPPLAMSLLMDLSASVNSLDPSSGVPVLTLACNAVLLLAQSITELGSPLALAGFRSNGRHEISYLRVKGFGDPFDIAAKQRLAALEGKHSTRMGAAIRHAVTTLATQVAAHRLLLVVTDGEPADIDVFDQNHLTHDARHAVMDARRKGVHVFCVSLDAQAEPYVIRIFGAGCYLVLDSLKNLPDKLSRLLLRLVRQGF